MRSLLSVLCITIAGIVLFITGCSTEECYDNRNALPFAGFYGVVDGKMGSISVESLTIYGLGAPGDSVLSEGSKSISNIYLPFRIDSDTTSYVFRIDNPETSEIMVSDTVTFVYSRDVRFVSSACGASYVFNIQSIKNSGLLIDSVVVPEGKITNADRENIEIYFNTGEQPTL
ncbi:MAG: hypothetical protein K2L89_04175 [Muribaculaceae bacterium]|nr:hypothetical protein [Muribaculaceae bacterium]